MICSQIEFDTGWMKRGTEFNAIRESIDPCTKEIDVSTVPQMYHRQNYMKVPISQVENIQTFAKGFLYGSLWASGYKLDEVVFLKAGYINLLPSEYASPVYIFIIEDHFQLETWFVPIEKYNKVFDTSY